MQHTWSKLVSLSSEILLEAIRNSWRTLFAGYLKIDKIWRFEDLIWVECNNAKKEYNKNDFGIDVLKFKHASNPLLSLHMKFDGESKFEKKK